MSDTPSVTDSETQAQPVVVEGAGAAEQAPAKRTRRPRAAKEAAPKAEAAAADSAASAPAEEPAKKPTRKRTAKKPAAKTDKAAKAADAAEGAKAAKADEAPVAEAAAEEAKPAKAAAKRASRTTRSRKKADGEATADPAADPASMEALLAAQAEILAAATAAAAQEAEAPRPKRTSRRKSAEQVAEAAEPVAQAVVAEAGEAAQAERDSERPEQENPRPRRGRSRKAASEAAAEGEAPVAVEAPAEGQAPVAEAPAEAQDAPVSDSAAASEGADAVATEAAAPADGSEKSERRPRRNKVKMGERRKSEDGERRKSDDDRRKAEDDRRKQKNERNKRRNKRHERNKEVVPSVTREELAELKVADLRAKAAELELNVTGLKKAELVEAVFTASVKAEGFIEVEGVLDIMSDGYGFLRTHGYLPSETDCYVPTSVIRRNHLRKGDYLAGQTRPARENEKFPALQKIETINGMSLEESAHRVRFADLTPIYPDERLLMEHGKSTITARVIDLAAPIGKGQRGLIVSPPKAGKTTVLKDIAAAISANNPDVHLMCLLVDERPEEVTDMQRSIKGEVISSTFDMPCENHIAVAELVIERAKRLVENGRDVVVLLDSLTRLARAYNLAQPASGRILSGGVDSTALYPPKKFLGAARNIEGGGSLTILASALVDTGSKMDEVIFEEFKGTGNMELKLDRNLADRRIFPAIDPVTSGTRKEDLLLNPQEAPLIWAVRRLLANMNNTERAMDMLIKSLKQTDDNQEFLIRTAKKAQQNKSGNISEL